jgi:D-proline reductase (dithiol) PrdB
MMSVMRLRRLRNQAIAKLCTFSPMLLRGMLASYSRWESWDVPWTPVVKPLWDCTVAIVTTAGVHHKDQDPFDMYDREGDPTFRPMRRKRPINDLMITHDYYDHSDADRDINIVFPVERLGELEQMGIIGKVAETHYGFMGHIDGRHLHTLVHETATGVARRLKTDGVDVVLLTPG